MANELNQRQLDYIAERQRKAHWIRPDKLLTLTPKPKAENCRNCGAAPELDHPHACGWCTTPR